MSRTGQSRPHKQNTQEGGLRARTPSGAIAEPTSPALSGAERISLERRLAQIHAELVEACRKKEISGLGAFRRAMPPPLCPGLDRATASEMARGPRRDASHRRLRTRDHRRGAKGILRANATASCIASTPNLERTVIVIRTSKSRAPIPISTHGNDNNSPAENRTARS